MKARRFLECTGSICHSLLPKTKLIMKLLSTWAVVYLAAQAAGAALSHKLDGFTIREHPDAVKRAQLQKFVCGTRIG